MARRSVLTFDLDGVLCRPPFGINPGRNEHKRRDGAGRRNILWLTERWRYAFRQPMPGAREGFAALSAAFECHVVSARAESARRLTERWFEHHIGALPPIHLRASWMEKPAQFKARMVTELGPIAHFEDDPHTAEWLSELLPAVFLIGWPRNDWLNEPNIHRISRLGEALSLLDEVAARSISVTGTHTDAHVE